MWQVMMLTSVTVVAANAKVLIGLVQHVVVMVNVHFEDNHTTTF